MNPWNVLLVLATSVYGCVCFTSVAVSPGDQLLHPEKKKTRAEREAEEDQVDSPTVPSKYNQLGWGGMGRALSHSSRNPS